MPNQQVVGVVVVVALASWSAVSRAQPADAKAKLLATKEWRGSFSIKHAYSIRVEGCTEELESTEQYSGVTLKLDDDFGDGKCWAAKVKANVSHHFKRELKSDGGSYVLEEDNGNGDGEATVRLCVYAEDDKYRITTSLDKGPKGTRRQIARSPGVPPVDKTESRQTTTFRMLDKAEGPLPLNRSLTGKAADTPQHPTACGMTKLAFTESWGFSGDPLKPKAYIDPPPKPWLPEVGKETSIKVRWTESSAEQVEVSLEVGNEPGAYMNDTDTSTAADLAIPTSALHSGWRVVPMGRNAKKYTATVKDLDTSAREITLPLVAHDNGAYGKARARVKIAGSWIQAETDTGKPVANVPFDDNDNKIADQWEEDEQVARKAATWDEDWLPDGPAHAGDTLTLYQEYRGFWALDPGSRAGAWRRLNPRVREHFVEDPAKLVDVALFKQATGIQIVLIDPAHQQRRVTNFRKGWGHKRDKYAVKLEAIGDATTGFIARKKTGFKKNGFNDASADKNTAGSCAPSGAASPKAIVFCVIFVDNLKRSVTQGFTNAITEALKDPKSEAGQALARLHMTDNQILDAKRKMAEPGFVDKVLRQQLNMTVIHELAHSMGVGHHNPQDKGVTSCPVRYDTDDETAAVLIRAIGHENDSLPAGVAHLCGSTDNCEAKIHLLD